jgi:hypothetical protein
MFRKIMMLLSVFMLPMAIFGQVSEAGKPVKVVTDADIVGTTVWSSDTVWNISGFVFVESGERLIIEPGTIIKGDPGQGTAATALIVARGGKIYAEGTPKNPIIFTSIDDNVDDPNDIPLGAAGKGMWGSVIILGNATVATATGTAQIEGIPETETRGNYGGPDANDNSGIFRYVSLRHGGSIIGANNEINGLTLGGVGRGTRIDHVEAFQNLDDGFEFFGGTVNTSYLAAVFCDDDGFDWDFGYSGSGQYWFCLKDSLLPSSGSRGHEMDYCTPGGCVAAAGVWPYVSNVTSIGSGVLSNETDNDVALIFRSSSGGYFYNSVYEDWARQAVNISNAASLALLGTQLKLVNNLFYGFGSGSTFTALCVGTGVDTYMSANDQITTLPNITSISRHQDNGLNPLPINAAAGGAVAVSDPNGYIKPTTYRGAFDPTARNWLCGWSATSFYNILTQCGTAPECANITDNGKAVKVVTDANITGTTVWNQDTVINLSGFVFVDNGEQLIIGPGTIIKGDPGQAASASALIVARGGKIYATGAADQPIVFTSIDDDVDDPLDIPTGLSGRGLWGSVLILGASTVTTATGVAQIEGIPETEVRGNYGGVNSHDNSGVFRYVSLRHGGSIIGANNEINGLTMGGVGDGTVIDHVEAYQNLDDGFEWFGGTVNTSYLVAAFCDDDGFDWDFGFSGSNQFWFQIKDNPLPSSGSRGHECDYCTPGGCVAAPGVWAHISNVTSYGSGKTSGETDNDLAMIFRSGSGGYLYNSIYADWARKAVDVSNAASNALLGSQLKIEHNYFSNFGSGSTWTALCNGTGVDTYMAAHNTLEATDPLVRGVSRTQNGGLDPRPATCSDAATSFQAVVDPNGYIKTVGYSGAFNPVQTLDQSWIAGWTFLYCGGYVGEQTPYTCSCCLGNTGNVDGDTGDVCDISDLSSMVDYLFFGGTISSCFQENDVNTDSAVDISDLQSLIDFLFFGASLPTCP